MQRQEGGEARNDRKTGGREAEVNTGNKDEQKAGKTERITHNQEAGRQGGGKGRKRL